MQKIIFKVNYQTKWGERVVVLGNIPSLGNGRIEHSLALEYQADGNWATPLKITETTFDYQYVVIDENWNVLNKEWGEMRTFESEAYKKGSKIALNDSWRGKYHPENALNNAAFLKVIFNPRKYKSPKAKKTSQQPQLQFQINAPRVETGQQLCICGNIGQLGNWGATPPLLLGNENYPSWSGATTYIAGTNIEYKYGIYDVKSKEVVYLEVGENRTLNSEVTKGQDITIVNDAFFQNPKGHWKGTGVALPVFGLRSDNGLGVGEFNDIKLLIDWAKQVGMKMVQILPINDTSATTTWVDSYPYAAISVYALHPMFLNIESLKGFAKVIDKTAYKALQTELNALTVVDYEAVNKNKLAFARQIFNATKSSFLRSKAFKTFLNENEHWLKPYAYFCILRDQFKTANFNQWGDNATFSEEKMVQATDEKSANFDNIAFYYYLQFQLDAQLKSVTDYARKNQIVLKGDIPIGIYRHSVDAWTQPQLYHLDGQAGAPPDPFSDLGQNWGFPTYNWEVMAEDGYAWWQNRLKTLSKYFDAFRIDHILGFFRIWQVPLDAVQATLGFFNPAIPVSVFEFQEKGIDFDKKRYCSPYITQESVDELFGSDSSLVKAQFLQYQSDSHLLEFQPEFDTQRKLEAYLNLPENAEYLHLKEKLFELHSNVIFIEVEGSGGQAFHPRIDSYKTYSYQSLDKEIQDKIYAIYLDYFYTRQDDFWAKSAITKLPAIQSATDMLICGEDLGMIPDCVPQVMKDLDILTLEIQRMSKNPATEFLQAADTPYYSVSSPSTHDMSPIRLWWEEENRAYIQRFYNNELGINGIAPAQCTPEVTRAIIQKHLELPSMWTVFPISDLLGMSPPLRHADPEAERINVPANPKHYWRYRMHIGLEELVNNADFKASLQEMIEESGR